LVIDEKQRNLLLMPILSLVSDQQPIQKGILTLYTIKYHFF
jgi:hypothetical protein